jgi:hypothetical protein
MHSPPLLRLHLLARVLMGTRKKQENVERYCRRACVSPIEAREIMSGPARFDGPGEFVKLPANG